jgi:type II secretory pathway predicted ATPase ExeA
VHQISVEQDSAGRVVTKRLLLALLAYAAIAVLAIKTLDDPRIRGATLAILALFAVKTWVRRNEVMHPEGSDQ